MTRQNNFRLAVLVSGRGSNLQAIIDGIAQGSVRAEIAVVISNRADAYALERCQKQGIETLFINPKEYADRAAFDRALIEAIQARNIDLVCLAGYMRILGREFIEAFPRRIINIHPSLLPAFPGLDAQKQALEAGVKVAGCTAHFVDVEVDAGPIILQATVPVLDTDDAETLSQRILEQEHIIFPKAVQHIANGEVTFSENRVLIQSPTGGN